MANISTILDAILAEHPTVEFKTLIGFEDAVIGVEYLNNRLVYDVIMIIAILMEDYGLDEDQALNYFHTDIALEFKDEPAGPLYISM